MKWATLAETAHDSPGQEETEMLTKPETIKILAELSAAFQVPPPRLQWSVKATNGRWWPGLVQLGPKLWRGKNAILHEFAHHLAWCRVHYDCNHQKDFQLALWEVAEVFYKDGFKYAWSTEYVSLRRFGHRRPNAGTARNGRRKKMETNPKGERRCAVGVGPNGEPTFEQFVRLAWAEADHTTLVTALDKCVEALEQIIPIAPLGYTHDIAHAALDTAKKARGWMSPYKTKRVYQCQHCGRFYDFRTSCHHETTEWVGKGDFYVNAAGLYKLSLISLHVRKGVSFKSMADRLSNSRD